LTEIDGDVGFEFLYDNFFKKDMNKKSILCVLFAIFMTVIVFFGFVVKAQDNSLSLDLRASAGGDKNVAVGKKVVFDASKTTDNRNSAYIGYYWDFGDGTYSEGREVIHSYNLPGEYKVVLNVNNGYETDKDEITVNVYKDLVLLVADKTPTSDQIRDLKRDAARNQALLVAIINRQGEADYVIEGALSNALLEAKEDVQNADILILWTSGSLGLNAMSKFAQSAGNLADFRMDQKGIVSAGKNVKSNARIAQSTYDVLKPEYILLVKDSYLNSVISSHNSDDLLSKVQSDNAEHTLIGKHSERAVTKLGATNFLSYSINYLINRGVAIDNLFLLLMLPIIATLIAFLRQILGIKTFGIYTPTIITLCFISTGLKYGLTIFIVILLVATVLRFLLRKFKLLYLPRMAIVLCVVALVLLFLFMVGAYFNKTGMITLSILPILVLIIMVEKFIAVQIEKGGITAILLSLETILVSVVCYWIVNWEWFKTLILSYPELVLLTIVANVALGKWTGLRLSEYFRFKALLKKNSKS